MTMEPFSRLQTTTCPVLLRLVDGSALQGTLWLLPDSASPTGVTSVESLLGGTRDFVAVGTGGQSCLVQRDSIRIVEIDPRGPGASSLTDAGASLDVVTFHLDSGESVSGILRAVAREGQQRMSDVFNASGNWIPLLAGDRLLLVARKRIVKVTF
jgi:hypothetical protein